MDTLDENYRIEYLYHITDISNLQNILNYGILSHNQAHNYHLLKKDISNQAVNDRRDKIENIYNRNLHDYVPLYFNPKNPMLSARRDIQDKIIILCIEKTLLYRNDVLISDGNAASSNTIFFKGRENLTELDWNCINASVWNKIEDGTRKRCSEILVPNKIHSNFFRKILVYSDKIVKLVEPIVKNRNIEIEINNKFYF